MVSELSNSEEIEAVSEPNVGSLHVPGELFERVATPSAAGAGDSMGK